MNHAMRIADSDELKFSSSLLSFKGTTQALLEACHQKDATNSEIARLIQTDSVLCSYLIHLVNVSNQATHVVTSLSEAVSLVGIPVIKQLAIGFSLIDQFRNGSANGFDYQEFWSHSLLMALAMQELGKTARICTQDELFACGLMARIGCLALATTHPDKYAALIIKQKQNSSISLATLEQQYLQTDHNELTATLLSDFGLPKILVEAVYYHEVPAESGFSEGSYPFQLVNLIHLAKQIADFGLASESERTVRISELMLLSGKIGLDTESFGNLIDQITQEWHAYGKILQIETINLPSFHNMLSASVPYLEMTTSDAPWKVLLVEDDPFGLETAEEVLADMLGYTVFSATNGKQALSLAMDIMPHIIVTDWAMPVMDGLALTRALRTTAWGQNMYIIMLTGYEDDKKIVEAFEAGVNDYMTKPVNVPAFRARLHAAWHYRKLQEAWERDQLHLKRFAAELAVTNHKLKHDALTDMLTGIPNRRAGMKALTGAWNSANRSGQSIAVMLIDIDHFKKINDTYGHAIGDRVLKEVATSIRNITRKGEIFCRIGGEEFLMICPNGCTDAKSAFPLAERLRQHVKMQEINIDETRIQISISIGIALKDAGMKSDEQLVKAADRALYAAKNAGRDRVYLAIENQLISSNFC